MQTSHYEEPRGRREQSLAEQELLERVQQRVPSEEDWELLNGLLAEYAFPTMVSWIVEETPQKDIFRRCADQGRGVQRPGDQDALREDASSLAAETIGQALRIFRNQLEKRGWDPNGRARITSAFMVQCILSFPNVYRAWVRQHKHVRYEMRTDPLELIEIEECLEPRASTDPATIVMDRTEIRRAAGHLARKDGTKLDLREAMAKKAEGFRWDEIANDLDISPKQLESQVARSRAKIRNAAEEKGDEP